MSEDVQPPPDLERRVIASLYDRGLIAPPRRRWRLLAAAAAVVVAFGAGRFSAAEQNAPPARYVLLLRGAGGPEGDVDAHRRWARSLQERNLLVDAHQLGDFATVLGPEKQRADDIRGYFVIAAAHAHEATAVARECPHLRGGGSVEVREIK